jgi:hypothetical protein
VRWASQVPPQSANPASRSISSSSCTRDSQRRSMSVRDCLSTGASCAFASPVCTPIAHRDFLSAGGNDQSFGECASPIFAFSCAICVMDYAAERPSGPWGALNCSESVASASDGKSAPLRPSGGGIGWRLRHSQRLRLRRAAHPPRMQLLHHEATQKLAPLLARAIP